jgi:hypothetical protein
MWVVVEPDAWSFSFAVAQGGCEFVEKETGYHRADFG